MFHEGPHFWTKEAWIDAEAKFAERRAQIRELVIHDPCRHRRLRIFLVAVFTVLTTAGGLNCLFWAGGVAFNVWTHEQTWQLLFACVLLLAMSFPLTPILHALPQVQVQKRLLLLILFYVAFLLPLLGLIWIVNLRFIYPQVPFFRDALREMAHLGLLGYALGFCLWIVAIGLLFVWITRIWLGATRTHP